MVLRCPHRKNTPDRRLSEVRDVGNKGQAKPGKHSPANHAHALGFREKWLEGNRSLSPSYYTSGFLAIGRCPPQQHIAEYQDGTLSVIARPFSKLVQVYHTSQSSFAQVALNPFHAKAMEGGKKTENKNSWESRFAYDGDNFIILSWLMPLGRRL